MKKVILGLLIFLTLANVVHSDEYPNVYYWSKNMTPKQQDAYNQERYQKEQAVREENRRIEIEHKARPQNFGSQYADSWTAKEWFANIMTLGAWDCLHEDTYEDVNKRHNESVRLLKEIRYKKYKKSMECSQNGGGSECWD